MAESVKKLSSVCLDCGEKAAFTKRVTKDETIQLIGDLDLYKPVCRRCFYCKEENLTMSTKGSEASPLSEGERKERKSSLTE